MPTISSSGSSRPWQHEILSSACGNRYLWVAIVVVSISIYICNEQRTSFGPIIVYYFRPGWDPPMTWLSAVLLTVLNSVCHDVLISAIHRRTFCLAWTGDLMNVKGGASQSRSLSLCRERNGFLTMLWVFNVLKCNNPFALHASEDSQV